MLIKGMVFKNYKELCKHMGWKVQSGAAKKAQIKELETMCIYYKQGNSIIIDDVFETKLVKEDKRRNNNVYIDLIETLIIYKLQQSGSNIAYCSIGVLGEEIGMFNSGFRRVCFYDDDYQIDYFTLRYFKMNTKGEAQKIINRALKSMKNRKLIDYSFGKLIVFSDGTIRRPNMEEGKILLDCEEKVMKDLGCVTIFQIENRRLRSEFNYRLRKLMHENDMRNFESSFTGYEIYSTTRIMNEELKEQETRNKRMELNKLFIIKMYAIFNARYKCAVKKVNDQTVFGEGFYCGESSEGYLQAMYALIEKYVKLE